MAQKDLFKRGECIYYTPVFGTSDIPPQDVKARIDWTNAPKRLNTFFFGIEVLKLIQVNNSGGKPLKPSKNNWENLKKQYNKNKKEIYLVSVKSPTSGYSETSLLFVVGKVSQLTGNSKKNDLVYKYPKVVRNIYWNTILEVMRKFRQLQQMGKLSKNFAHLKPAIMGHHGCVLTKYPPYENHPGIRSVILHHDHGVFVNEEQIKPTNWDDSMFNLDKQSRLFWSKRKPNLTEFLSKLNSYPGFSKLGIKLQLRKHRPVGYQAKVDYTNRSISKIDKLLKLHFSAYSDLVKKSKLLSKSILIQPAFTFYLIPEDTKQALVIFTPNIFSGPDRVAGAPERAGILIRRRPDVPRSISEKEKVQFYKKIVS